MNVSFPVETPPRRWDDDDDDAEDEVLYSAAEPERESQRRPDNVPLVPLPLRRGGGGSGGFRTRPASGGGGGGGKASPSPEGRLDVLDARWLLAPGKESTRAYVPLRPSSAQSGLSPRASSKQAVNVPSRLRSSDRPLGGL